MPATLSVQCAMGHWGVYEGYRARMKAKTYFSFRIGIWDDSQSHR
jgi:hypothetical protein